MKNFTSRLNFSNTQNNENAIKIDCRKDISYFDTLCLYCANNNINLDSIDNDDFSSAAMRIEDYGKKSDVQTFFFGLMPNT